MEREEGGFALSLVLTATGERKEEGWREEIASLSLLLQGWLACVMCARVIKSVERKAFGSRCVCTRAARMLYGNQALVAGATGKKGKILLLESRCSLQPSTESFALGRQTGSRAAIG